MSSVLWCGKYYLLLCPVYCGVVSIICYCVHCIHSLLWGGKYYYWLLLCPVCHGVVLSVTYCVQCVIGWCYQLLTVSSVSWGGVICYSLTVSSVSFPLCGMVSISCYCVHCVVLSHLIHILFCHSYFYSSLLISVLLCVSSGTNL